MRLIVKILLVTVLLAVGWIAFVFIAGFWHTIQHTKHYRSAYMLEKINEPLRRYASDHKQFPVSRSGEDLRRALVPRYAPDEAVRDGWGRLFRATINPQNYLIWSPGRDDRRDSARWSLERNTASMIDEVDRDVVIYNGNFLQYPEGRHVDGLGSVTVLDAKSDRSNTGSVYVDVRNYVGTVQIRAGDKVVAENASLFEVPPGVYTFRVVLRSGQTFDEPGTFTVERQRVLQHTLNPRGQLVTIEVRPRPPDGARLEVWSGSVPVLMKDLSSETYADLLAGPYVVKITWPNGQVVKRFTARVTPEVGKWVIDVPRQPSPVPAAASAGDKSVD